MALRIALPPTTFTTNGTRRRRHISIIKSSSLKQKPKKHDIPAAAAGFDAGVVEQLERLFRDDTIPIHPQRSSGSHSPVPCFGFWGRPVRVAYQGVRGSYCQEAAVKAFSSISCEAFPCHDMEAAFQSLQDESADRAVIPVENSIDGPIDRNLDLLLRHHDDVEIAGEVIIPVNHCLLAIPATSRSQLKHVISHPQALTHCKFNLQALDLHVQQVPNSAHAAQFLAHNTISDTAVIGSKIAAKEFGLQILQDNFQDPITNFNRFLQLKLKSPKYLNPLQTLSSSTWKTTVAFSLNNGVSDLFRALWLFQTRNVTVTRVEHRPNRSNPIKVVEKQTGDHRYFDYVFILDLKGHVTESGIQTALSRLGEISGFARVLGSYTSDSVS